MVRSPIDLRTGLLFLAIGGLAAAISSTYQMGSASRIGPGFFPFWLGLVLAVMGVGLVVQSLTRRSRDSAKTSWDWLTLFKVLVSVIIFAAALSTLGLVVSLVLLVLVSSFASHEFQLRVTLLNAAAISVGTVIIFVWALRIYLPLWPNLSRFF